MSLFQTVSPTPRILQELCTHYHFTLACYMPRTAHNPHNIWQSAHAKYFYPAAVFPARPAVLLSTLFLYNLSPGRFQPLSNIQVKDKFSRLAAPYIKVVPMFRRTLQVPSSG